MYVFRDKRNYISFMQFISQSSSIPPPQNFTLHFEVYMIKRKITKLILFSYYLQKKNKKINLQIHFHKSKFKKAIELYILLWIR